MSELLCAEARDSAEDALLIRRQAVSAAQVLLQVVLRPLDVPHFLSIQHKILGLFQLFRVMIIPSTSME